MSVHPTVKTCGCLVWNFQWWLFVRIVNKIHPTLHDGSFYLLSLPYTFTYMYHFEWMWPNFWSQSKTFFSFFANFYVITACIYCTQTAFVMMAWIIFFFLWWILFLLFLSVQICFVQKLETKCVVVFLFFHIFWNNCVLLLVVFCVCVCVCKLSFTVACSDMLFSYNVVPSMFLVTWACI